MTETLDKKGYWALPLIREDLIIQGGISSDDLRIENGRLYHKERKLEISHDPLRYLLISVKEDQNTYFDEIINAFNIVTESRPLAKYVTRTGDRQVKLSVCEWVWDAPKERLEFLKRSEILKKLKDLNFLL